MAYTTQNFVSGQILKAAELNHMETGIASLSNEVESMKTAKIVLRNDTAANWAAVGNTLILLKGEPGVEFPEDGGAPKIKIGDGVTVWNDLEYIAIENDVPVVPGDTTELENRVTILEETVGGFDIRI